MTYDSNTAYVVHRAVIIIIIIVTIISILLPTKADNLWCGGVVVRVSDS